MFYLQVGIACAGLAVDPPILQLREVALEEADLVLVRGTRDVRRRPLDREVVVHSTSVDGSLRLRDQLGSPHVTVPLGCAVDRDLRALFATGICGVLVV